MTTTSSIIIMKGGRAQCPQCECTYKHVRSLIRHGKKMHNVHLGAVESERTDFHSHSGPIHASPVKSTEFTQEPMHVNEIVSPSCATETDLVVFQQTPVDTIADGIPDNAESSFLGPQISI